MSERGKHTPVPWQVGARYVLNEGALIQTKDGWCVAEASNGLPGGFEETLANEALIAAAPELLGACQAAIAYDKAIRGRAQAGDFEKLDPRGAIAEGVDLDTLYEEWITLSMCAIAKAEGRP